VYYLLNVDLALVFGVFHFVLNCREGCVSL
jgi:hypothetical protein